MTVSMPKPLSTWPPMPSSERFREKLVAKAQQHIGDYLYPKISGEVGGRRHLIDQPPAVLCMLAENENVNKGFQRSWQMSRSFMRHSQATAPACPTSAAGAV